MRQSGSGSGCLWGSMECCAPIGNRCKLARVTNPRAALQPAPHLELTHYRQRVTLPSVAGDILLLPEGLNHLEVV